MNAPPSVDKWLHDILGPLNKAVATADRIGTELRLAAPRMGPNALRYAEAVCATSDPEVLNAMTTLFEAGDVSAVEAWIDQARQTPIARWGSTAGWWERTDGFRPGELMPSDPRRVEWSEIKGPLPLLP